MDKALKSQYHKFVDGSHILHNHGVLDAYGHLSFRHPQKPDVLLMSRNTAPAMISSANDLIEYWIDNAEPVNPKPGHGYTERHIHSEIYKRRTDINAVIHSHSEAVIPYTIAHIPLRACYHMAGFLGVDGVPVYEISDHLEVGDVQDMLVRNQHLGSALAKYFDNGNVVTLMRGHGFTTVAETIELAVQQAVYTQKNAAIQTATLTLGAASAALTNSVPASPPSSIQYLNQEEAKAAAGMARWSSHRPWDLWVREVRVSGLYVNLVSD